MLGKTNNIKPESFFCKKKNARYAIKFDEPAIVDYSGIEDLLGYSKAEFNIKYLTSSSFYHPDDFKDVLKYSSSVLRFFKDYSDYSDGFVARLLYRVKHKSGKWVSILRRTYLPDPKNKNLLLSIITDVTKVVDFKSVLFDVKLNPEAKEKFSALFFMQENSVLNNREIAVLERMKQGKKPGVIAEELKSSREAIYNLQKRMYKKTGVSNAVGLINLIRNEGWI